MGQALQKVMGHSPGRGGAKSPPVLAHLVILPTPLTGLRGRTLGALGRVCFMRAGTCDTFEQGVWARAALRVAGGGGTNMVPHGVGTSTPATAGRVGTAQAVVAKLVAALTLCVAVETKMVFNLECC